MDINCEKCDGNGKDPNRPFENCVHCAGTGIHPEGFHVAVSEQFGTNCVVIETLDVDPDRVIAWANQVNAIYHEGIYEYFVVDFQVNNRLDGPDCYTESALRSSLKPKTEQT